MASVDTYPASSAFQTQLRTLCLREFPCGIGSWRETKTNNLQVLKNTENVDSRFCVTLKEYGPQHEKTETLEEYVGSKHSPWHLDYSWSSEAKNLRELAVKSPWLIDDQFVLNYFKTLRIVDKNVTEVDGELLKFQQLEELTLSANKIITVNSKNLPQNLKVLELCANKISDISALCVRPPPIIHLGLGYNKVSFIGDYLTGDFWPNLLSLDLSHNNLSDLLDVIRKLGTLPKLRNLILQGNPLSLIPGYRGYTIDSLRKLNILDDIMISADERHHYKGLARRREFILDEAKVTLEVSYIKGLPMPEELKNPEEQPEFPKIERNYYVQFMFLQDTSPKPEVLHITQDDFSGLSRPSTEASHVTSDKASPMFEERVPSVQSQATETVKNVNFTAEPEFASAREPTADHERPPDEVPPSTTPKTEDGLIRGQSADPTTVTIVVEPVRSGTGNWAEEIEINWSQVVVRDDLLALRNFFKKGMDISVMEEMVELTPLDSENGDSGSEKPQSPKKDDKKVLLTPNEDGSEPNTPTGKSKGKEGKEKKKDDKKEDKKDDKAKAGGKDDKKGGKKKKEPEVEMKRSEPTYTTLATWHIPLEEFLEGEYVFKSVFQTDGAEVASTVRSADIRVKETSEKVEDEQSDSSEKDRDKKKPGSSKPKDLKGGKDSRRSSVMGKNKEGRRSSAVGQKGGGKDDKKGAKDKGGKGAPPVAEEEEEAPPPPPLETQVTVRLHHWKTAMDSLKEEEEKAKPQEEAEQT